LLRASYEHISAENQMTDKDNEGLDQPLNQKAAGGKDHM